MFKKVVLSVAVVAFTLMSPVIGHAAFGDVTLKKEMWHQDVHELQQKLMNQGFFDYHKTTGYFGPITEKAVKDFQQQHQLKVDGIVGPKTKEALFNSNFSGTEAEGQKEIVVESTAYTAFCDGCSGITKTGIDLRANPDQKVIAVDPSVISLGTELHVEGYGKAIAGDIGSAINGNEIDVFIPSKEEAVQWGRKEVTVTILE